MLVLKKNPSFNGVYENFDGFNSYFVVVSNTSGAYSLFAGLAVDTT